MKASRKAIAGRRGIDRAGDGGTRGIGRRLCRPWRRRTLGAAGMSTTARWSSEARFSSTSRARVPVRARTIWPSSRNTATAPIRRFSISWISGSPPRTAITPPISRRKTSAQNDQDIELDLAQPGQQYLTLGWYQTPHLRSTTAQTIFNGVGTNNLTVPDAVVQQLYNGIANGIQPSAGTIVHLRARRQYGRITVPPAGGVPPPRKVPLGCFLPGQNGIEHAVDAPPE